MRHCCDKSDPPERQTLLLLRAALDLARRAVTDQHPRLAYIPTRDDPWLPASEVLAQLLVERCADLDAWIERYNGVIDHALKPNDDPIF